MSTSLTREQKKKIRDTQVARETALEQMNPELLSVYNEMNTKMEEEEKRNLRFYYWLGQKVNEVSNDGHVSATVPGTVEAVRPRNDGTRIVVIAGTEHVIEKDMRVRVSVDQEVKAGDPLTTGSKYGTGAMRLLGEAWSADVSMLYKSRAFAEAYTEEELEDLCNMRSKSGYMLGWAHVIALLSVPATTRVQLQEQVIEEDMTAKDLGTLIKKIFGKRRAGGPTLIRPKTLQGNITQMQTHSDRWMRSNTDVWNTEDFALFQQISDIPPEEVTHDMVDNLEALMETQEKMAAACAHNAQEAAAAVDYVRNVLQLREQELAAEIREDRQLTREDEPVPSVTGRRATGRGVTSGSAPQ
tara:strand:+ start:34651 stop:35718 length:1068 start_codon:yes stop_codon:yes gene_type:complete